jgi:transketolase
MAEQVAAKQLALRPRRGVFLEAAAHLDAAPVPAADLEVLAAFDLIYRTLCGMLYNFAPLSGHPGGSISSGRIVAGLLLRTLDYDYRDPAARHADILSYAAGHKAMGLYAMWALRNECVRIGRPDLLPDERWQLRLEDLLGFRKNPTQATPLFTRFRAKALDGHPTPQTPFVWLATGASGVGVPASFGLALGALDTYGAAAPRVHVLEGEGGLTAGRVSEALATAATAQLWTVTLHIDWNQASIDSNRVCAEDGQPGDYVQWDPAELCYLHDWNVVAVADGTDFRQVLAAQALARQRLNDQPTAIVYRTVKGWQYGIEGRKSHGAGHEFCSDAYDAMLRPMEQHFGVRFPVFSGATTPERVEAHFYETLLVVRQVLESQRSLSGQVAEWVAQSGDRLRALDRPGRAAGPNLQALYGAEVRPEAIPAELQYRPGSQVTLRAALSDVLNHLNRVTGGAFIGAAADLFDSTSISKLGHGFAPGLYNAVHNPQSRLIATGGICEDCMGAFLAGLSAYGGHVGVGSSYAAFIAALQHIAARLHGIGQQARRAAHGAPYQTFIIVCAHAGLKTGEDGATHADPQALQLMQSNFPDGVAMTLTPWDPQELWPLAVAALQHRPAVLVPFVTRPAEAVIDRAALKLPPAAEARKGVYALRRADPAAPVYHGTVVLQGSEVANTFVCEVLPQIDAAALNLSVYYVSSLELFARLPEAEQEAIFPARLAGEAMGITGFTLPTLYQWVASPEGRRRTLHAFSKGHYLGSGQAHKVLEEAGLHGPAQWEAVRDYARWMETSGR